MFRLQDDGTRSSKMFVSGFLDSCSTLCTGAVWNHETWITKIITFQVWSINSWERVGNQLDQFKSVKTGTIAQAGLSCPFFKLGELTVASVKSPFVFHEFWMRCGWLENDRFLVFGSTIPLNSPQTSPTLFSLSTHTVCVRQPAHPDVKVLFSRVAERCCFPSNVWRESHGPVDPSVAPTRTHTSGAWRDMIDESIPLVVCGRLGGGYVPLESF